MRRLKNKTIISLGFSLGLILGMLMLPGICQAATYYVSPTGNDNNSGSIEAPFKTIQKAANIVNPGDTVIVRDGTYIDTDGDQYVVWIKRSGSAESMITFKAENKWGAVLDGGQAYGQTKTAWDVAVADYGFILTNANYIRIEGFEIKNTEFGGIGHSSTCTNTYLYQNKIHDIARYYVDPCVNYNYAMQGHSGIGVSGASNNITIDSNLIYSIGRLPSGACSTYWFWDYNHDHGLYLSGDYITAKNNIFYDCISGWPVHFYDGGSAGDKKTGINIVNNTFSGTNPQRDGHITFGWPGITNTLIANNISYQPRSYMISASNCTYGDATVEIKNNLTTAGTILPTCSWTISNNLINTDPKFVDSDNGDYNLLSASPAINAGYDLVGIVDNDYAGITRPQISGFDIGAYEYVSVDTTPPAAPSGLTVQ